MWTIFITGLLITVILTLLVFLIKLQLEKSTLRNNMASIRQEENRIFNFLHSLGEAFTEQLDKRDLYRMIVSGAVDVMTAQGGMIYLADKKLQRLLPSFISRGCLPLVPVPEHVITHAGNKEAAIESFLRLHSIPFGEGLIGEAYENRRAQIFSARADSLQQEGARQLNLQPHSAIIAPLIYGDEILGVLCVCRQDDVAEFNESDQTVFLSLVEQSAFALFSAKIYTEAGEKRRLDNDLHTAKEIQSILLPNTAPKIKGYQIAGRTLPARLVSGDYFDFIPVDDERLGLVIADVSGKGVPASLIMAMCRSVLRNNAPGCSSPKEVLSKVNRQLYPDMKEDMFISIAYLILKLKDNSLTLCRAGHDAPLYYSSSSGSITELNPKGMALGIDSGEVFDRVCTDFTVSLATGDCLVLYTDGVTEAIDNNGLEFGMGRMKQSILSGIEDGASGIISQVIEDLKEFTGDQDQYDDITMITIAKHE